MSAQFVALLTDDLWKRNAVHANAMAERLAVGVDGVAGVRVTDEPQANAVFAVLDPRAIAVLQDEFAFYTWNEAIHQVRWMTSWATTEDDVDTFVSRIREVAPTYA
jgi:threonine aldolase